MVKDAPTVATIGGIRTAIVSRSELATLMIGDVARARDGMLPEPRTVFSSNGSVVARYHNEPAFRDLIDGADVIDADGMPLVLASRMFLSKPLIERVATTDFILDACQAAVDNGIRFYFLGGKPGVAEEAADTLRARFPGLQIVGTRDGYFTDDDVPAVCRNVRESGADILWLGLGSPRQEAFAIANRSQLGGLAWVRTCGGLFDHYTAGARRAPQWMQSVGLEWLHRVRQEPLRLGWRYLTTNPVAAYYLLTRTHD